MARAENAECPKIGPPPALQRPSSRPPAGTLPHPRPPHLTQTLLLTTDASMQSHRNQEMVVHCFLLSEEFVCWHDNLHCEDYISTDRLHKYIT